MHDGSVRLPPELPTYDICTGTVEMANLPKPERHSPADTRAPKAVWWLCIVVILTVPGVFALMVGVGTVPALLITAFTAACVSISWLLIELR
uniref:Putative integral membrane protein n=2 Tax=Rhodococcus hoagii TaxID=43767 RepID=A0A1Z1UXC5_RHOHA|nr:putative integral membrane protein [Prescottella equi]